MKLKPNELVPMNKHRVSRQRRAAAGLMPTRRAASDEVSRACVSSNASIRCKPLARPAIRSLSLTDEAREFVSIARILN